MLGRAWGSGERVSVAVSGGPPVTFDGRGVELPGGLRPLAWSAAPRVLVEPRNLDVLLSVPEAEVELLAPRGRGATKITVRAEGGAEPRVTVLSLPPRANAPRLEGSALRARQRD